MTDLEITRLCAEALGLIEPCAYDPLHDDAQAMGLVKEMELQIACLPTEKPQWNVWHGTGLCGTLIQSFSHDLNRSICECVAKLQKAKEPA